MTDIKKQAEKAILEIIDASGIKQGEIFVVGCSTSEVCGDKIGTNSNVSVAKELFDGIYETLCKKGIYLAAQCCEHLNRCLIIEEELALKLGAEMVNVIPQPKAGGSFATEAYKAFKSPVAVERISAKAGIDIGGTLIGMHIAPVAVPLRIETKKIGEAPIICARSRRKFIGGVRAVYDENLL